MKHEIELKDLREWIEEGQEITFASSQGVHKKLVATVVGSFKVYDRGTVVYEGMQAFSAVEAYNNI